jgi:hypothetical protein
MANGLAGQGPQGGDILQEVIGMLQGGATPEQLVQMGIPVEIIEAAMAQLSQAAQAPVGPQGSGLAQQQGLI